MEYNEYYYFGLIAAVFVTACLTVAAIRWFHMCRPSDANARYYYPGRPYFVIAFSSALVLLPYVFHPESEDAWFMIRVFFLPIMPLHLTTLLLTYFAEIMEWKRWRLPMLAIGTPAALIMTAALVLAILPGEQIGLFNPVLVHCLLYIPGIVSTGVCLATLVVIRVWARRFNEDDYSNANDFPVVISRRWTLLTFINLMLCWTAVVLNNRGIMAVNMLLFSVATVVIVISALNPHRNGPMDEETPEAPEEETAPKRAISKKTNKEILSSIHIVVVEQQAYLESHLTIQDVADRCGYSRSYIAGIIKSEYGGFFNYINGLRLQNMEIYLNQHPDATVQEAAEASGFTSRQAYYTVKARLEKQK